MFHLRLSPSNAHLGLQINRHVQLMILHFFPIKSSSPTNFIIQLKYCLFVRKEGNYKDVFLNAKVDFFDEFDFCEDAIYCFRPPAEYTQLVNMKKEYILAISQCNKEDNTCKLRVIKSEVTQIKEGITFDIYDDKKHIGTAIFI